MQLTLNGKNIDITDAIRNYVKEKIERTVKHNGQIRNIRVTLSVTRNPSVKKSHTAEVTCFLNGVTLKVKEDAETMYAAIDLLADRFDRRVRESKEKLVGKSKHQTESIRNTLVEEEVFDDEDEEEAE